MEIGFFPSGGLINFLLKQRLYKDRNTPTSEFHKLILWWDPFNFPFKAIEQNLIVS